MPERITWCTQDIFKEADKYYLVMTHDTDSLLSCNYLERLTGIKVGGYFNYKNLYLNSEITENRIPIYIDCDVNKGYCFGNHFTLVKNPNAINLNYRVKEYHKKYAGSTIMTLFFIYEEDFDKFSDKELLFYSCIDGFYNQIFNARSWDYWADCMWLDYLTILLKKYTEKDMRNAISKYQLKCPVGLSSKNTLYWNGRRDLIKKNLNIDITVPDVKFDRIAMSFETRNALIKDLDQAEIDKMFCNTCTFKDKVRYSVITKDWGNEYVI